MTEEQVNRFVDGCMPPPPPFFFPFFPERGKEKKKPYSHTKGMTVDYPSYELYTDTLREGVFKPAPDTDRSESAAASEGDWRGRQLRLVVDKDRRVREVVRI